MNVNFDHVGLAFPICLALVCGGCPATDDAPANTSDTGSTGDSTTDVSSSGDGVVPTTDGPNGGDTTGDGSDDSTGAPTTAGEDDESSAGDGSERGGCSVTQKCSDPAPDGWTGPLYLADDATECGAPYPELVWEGGNGVANAENVCSCGCDITAESCDESGIILLYVNGCDNPWDVAFVLDPTGDVMEQYGGQALSANDLNDDNQASCTAMVDEAVLPEPSFSTNSIACAPTAAPTECGDDLEGICVPASSTQRCIMSPGDVECPSGIYTDRTVRYVDFSDTRSCDCGCEAEPNCTPGSVTLDLVPLDGGPPQQVIVADGTCNETDFFGFIESGVYTPGDPIATCTPEGGLNGQVEVAEPVTFCCD